MIPKEIRIEIGERLFFSPNGDADSLEAKKQIEATVLKVKKAEKLEGWVEVSIPEDPQKRLWVPIATEGPG